MAEEFNVLALFKGEERYIYIYDDDSRADLIDCFRNQAADAALNFNWFDAAVLTDKARQQGLANASERQAATPSRITEVLPDEGFERS